MVSRMVEFEFMTKISRRQFCRGLLYSAALVALAVPASAKDSGGSGGGGDDGDNEGDEIPGHSEAEEHNFALESVSKGTALPLIDILVEVQKSVPGQLLEARLKRRHGTLIYVLTVLSAAGIYSLVVVDAKTKKILEIKEK
jgi:uncharacterized membrane protein YkoI